VEDTSGWEIGTACPYSSCSPRKGLSIAQGVSLVGSYNSPLMVLIYLRKWPVCGMRMLNPA